MNNYVCMYVYVALWRVEINIIRVVRYECDEYFKHWIWAGRDYMILKWVWMRMKVSEIMSMIGIYFHFFEGSLLISDMH